MAKLLPAKEVQQFLKCHMTYDDYSFHQIFMIYKSVMNRNGFLKYRTMSADSLRKRLNEWSDVDGSWLGKKGDKGNTMYFKYEPPKRKCIDFKRAKALVNKIWEPMKW